MNRLGLCAASLAVSMTLAGAAACRRTAPPADGRTAVWLDVSPAFGDPPRDPGDALALLQAYGSGRLRVRGVSVTFGNVPLVRGYPAARELVKRLDTGLLRPWRGPSSPEERAAPTEATELLEEALDAGPLTFVAAGPLTTLASALQRQPGLASRLERVIVVAGRGIADDPASAQALLDTSVPLTLIPADASTGVALTASDLDRLDAGPSPVRLVAPAAREWLRDMATRQPGTAAFPVPAMLAVDVTAHPGAVRCEPAVARLARGPGAASLQVSGAPGATGRPVTLCHTADAGATARILADLLRVTPVTQ